MKIRITTELPSRSIELLRQLAYDQNITLTEALRRAVATTSVLHKRVNEGYNILLEHRDQTMTQLHLTR